MNDWQLFLAGIDPAHLPALFAGLAAPVAIMVYGWIRRQNRRVARVLAEAGPAKSADMTERADMTEPTEVLSAPAVTRIGYPALAAVWLLAVAAAVHLALPLGGNAIGWSLGYLVVGVGYASLAVLAYRGRHWRLATGLAVTAVLVAYLIANGSGRQQPDQVGIATAVVELVVLGLCLVPMAEPGRPRRVRRTFAGLAYGLIIVVVGAVTWGDALAAHHATQSGAGADAASVADAASGGHQHGGVEHSTRAQAGVLVPDYPAQATAAQVAAAAQLAQQTKDDLAQYLDIRAALAAGYRATLTRTGLSVHLENKAYQNDGRILDPQRPEMLMYAIADGRATLLSAVYQMPRAGQAAPDPGGPITRWHAHNACLSLLPPGLSLVDPFAGCPPFSIDVTVGEMMHVWVVDDPQGPYADSVPDSWTRQFNLTHGVPFSW